MKIGVIIGRFQVPELTAGHQELFALVQAENDSTLCLLGEAALYGLKRNPLPFEVRKWMIEESQPDVMCLPLYDKASDDVWSMQVDNIIALSFPMATEVTIYGGRESFIPHYKGRYKVREVETRHSLTGTQARLQCKHTYPGDESSRHGAIWAREHTFPGVKMAVDVALVRGDLHEVLLGRKPGNTLWQFPGGFVDPKDESLEAAAERELAEETAIVAGKMRYLGSIKVDDWRLRSEPEYGITTALFVATAYNHSDVARADDDLEEVKWFNLFLENDPTAVITPTHELLYRMLEKFATENDDV